MMVEPESGGDGTGLGYEEGVVRSGVEGASRGEVTEDGFVRAEGRVHLEQVDGG